MRVPALLAPLLFPALCIAYLLLLTYTYMHVWGTLILAASVFVRLRFSADLPRSAHGAPLGESGGGGDGGGVPYAVSGSLGGPLMCFLHGWPDDARVFDAQLKEFGRTHRKVAFDLPHFGDAAAEAGNAVGYDFDALVDRIAVSLVAALAASNQKAAVLVVHDWGSVYGMMLQRRFPALVSRLVVIDVAWPSPRPARFAQLPVLLALGVIYQYWLVLAWAIAVAAPPPFGASLGRAMTTLMMRALRAPRSSVTARAHEATALMNFPYFYFQWSQLMEMLGLRAGFDATHGTRDAPVPTLFLYGADKAFHFHSAAFERRLRERHDCRVVPVSRERNGGRGVGHWVQVTAPDIVNAEIRDWLGAAGCAAAQ